ncbi:pyrroloquinoline quinone biosynthesis protein PqqE [Acidisoma silvae]|uniref:PqqA peptide cyclase n=1 Tax=Acidisoma silvae TaxID=2802396 RepID=A0A963YVD5_9PROT|nr:pyrroloquinoline quinone biosynthesis protein PqqE [Acidisoma silvae]MCB8877836.1 pyrroloquinoline quinone biosynthesis protein PqqE [Acidisoma silvae]
MSAIPLPMALVAEVTHRCPLRCPYCSNPLEMARAAQEVSTEDWSRVFAEAAALGVLHLHLSGGEPMLRTDLPDLIRAASTAGLYVNLITSGVTMDAAKLGILVDAGLDHVQLSFQHADAAEAERIGGMKGAQARKLDAARLIKAAGLPLTCNFVIHRQNLHDVPAMMALASDLGAQRVEIAHTQYYGWGLINRNALLPDATELMAATAAVEAGRVLYAGCMAIDYVTPDYHGDQPKSCMDGWARRFIVISPTGQALSCHAAETITSITFPNIRETSLADIWLRDPAFQRFRGTDWMPEPCQGCALKEQDWGGCRCQALALLGDAAATDPVCARSPHHHALQGLIAARPSVAPDFVYRQNAKPTSP